MEDDKKKIAADHHDNVTRLGVESRNVIAEFEYIRNKNERDILYIKESWNRLVDMRINNFDKLIDLEIFLLKLSIPALGFSFAANADVLGINTDILRHMSFSMVIFSVLLVVITFIFRSRLVDLEQKRYNRQLDLSIKHFNNEMEKLEDRAKRISQDLNKALENEKNLPSPT